MTNKFFYKKGCNYALAKFGASLMQPTDQTYQIHREVDSPAHNGPDGKPADEVDSTPDSTQALWNEHDRRTQLSALLNTDTRIGT